MNNLTEQNKKKVNDWEKNYIKENGLMNYYIRCIKRLEFQVNLLAKKNGVNFNNRDQVNTIIKSQAGGNTHISHKPLPKQEEPVKVDEPKEFNYADDINWGD